MKLSPPLAAVTLVLAAARQPLRALLDSSAVSRFVSTYRSVPEALEGLDSSWAYEHDLPHGFGNWDHVVVGPGGIFLLDTKNMSGRIHARGDELQSGSIRHRGVGLRRSAAALSEALAQRLGKRPWVQPAYVIWGDFAQRRHEANGVAYVRGDELVSWLSGLPTNLAGARLDAALDAVRGIREDARDSEGALRA